MQLAADFDPNAMRLEKYAAAVFEDDRELHALFGLRIPQLSGVDPLKAARKLATPYEVDEMQWKRAAG